MVRKITQFRYFADQANLVSYYAIPSDILGYENGRISKEKFDILRKDLFVQTDEGKFIPNSSDYNENALYYLTYKEVNYPETLRKSQLISGRAFNNFTPIVKIGIQSLPGTRFRFNTNLDWIVMGATGIYELDLTNSSASILNMNFDQRSLDIIDENPNAYLIIDIVYEEDK